MANINVTIRVDQDLKEQADRLFEELGMSFTTAVNVFLKQSIREGGIPFKVGRADSGAERVQYTGVQISED